jgi:CubicO group peptidase (beta-lactamase class C family)
MRYLALVLVLTGTAVTLLTPAAQPGASIFAAQPKVDALFTRWDKSDSPGAALAIVKDGKAVYQRSYGMANLEAGLAITVSTVFLIASLSKQFTVFCILLLAQGGRLNLDDDVHKYVPEVPDFGKKITLRHLIHHTSGLREYLPLASYSGWRSGDALTERDVLDMVSKQKELNFEPGSQYLYCNTGYELLGVVVKRVSGQSLRDYAQKNIFEPLEMKHTQFRDDYKMVVPGLAVSYTPRPFGGFQYGLVHHGLAGASNVHTTVEDLARWDRNFYDAKVGGKKLIEQMHELVPLTTGKESDYAGGLRISKYRGLKTVEHTGAHGGFRTILLRFPEQQFSVILLANVSDINTTVMARKIADIFLEDKLQPLPKKDKGLTVAALDQEMLKRYGGEYLFDAGFLAQLTIKGDDIVTTLPTGQHRLQAQSNTEFLDASDGTRLVFTEKDGVLRVALHSFGQQLDGRQLQAQPQLTEAQRKALVGDFYSDELEVFFHLVDKDGKLWLRHRKGEFSLRPVAADEMLGDFGEYGGLVTLRFTRDGDKVVGFALSSGRVKGLKFARATVERAK